MINARPWERRIRTLVVFVVVTYALSSCLYLAFGTSTAESPTRLLLPNATWWKTNSPPYNMSLLDGSNDIKRLIDNPEFKFLINNKRCDGVERVFLVVFVHSAPTNFHKRQVIRNTWGNEGNLVQDPMRIVFLMGTVNKNEVQQQIDEENALYHDVVQGNFVDSYRNLTYKHVMGLKWVTYYCRQARFIFKADDDIFVDIFQLTTFLKETFGQTTAGVANLMMCYLFPPSQVRRSYRSKWRVSFKEYQGRQYPVYCAGWGVLMSPDVVFKLYLLSSKLPYFWIDDVHVTGRLASRVGISHVDFTEKLNLTDVDMEKWLNNENVIKPYLFGNPNLDSETILALWNRTMQYYHSPLVPSR